MYISTLLLNKALEKYNKAVKENYEVDKRRDEQDFYRMRPSLGSSRSMQSQRQQDEDSDYKKMAEEEYPTASTIDTTTNTEPPNMFTVTVLLILAIMVFMIEFIVLIYALKIAFKCAKAGGERTIHIILAVTFTYPYMLVMAVFSKCGGAVLRGETETSSYGFGGGCGCSANKGL